MTDAGRNDLANGRKDLHDARGKRTGGNVIIVDLFMQKMITYTSAYQKGFEMMLIEQTDNFFYRIGELEIC